MSLQSSLPPASSEQPEIVAPAVKAWSPIPVVVDNGVLDSDRAFVPLGSAVASFDPEPPELEDIGGALAFRATHDSVGPQVDYSDFESFQSDFESFQHPALSTARMTPMLPQVESTPVRAGLSHPTSQQAEGPIGAGQTAQVQRQPATGPTATEHTGTEPAGTEPTATELTGTEPAAPERSATEQAGHQSIRLGGRGSALPSTEPVAHYSAALAPVGPSLPAEVFPNAPRPIIPIRNIGDSGLFTGAESPNPAPPNPAPPNPESHTPAPPNPAPHTASLSAPRNLPVAPPVIPLVTPQVTQLQAELSQIPVSPIGADLPVPEVVLQPQAQLATHETHDQATLGVIDWRLMALTGLMAAYVPLLLRTLFGIRLSHPIGFGVLSTLLIPLAFIVIAARRPRRKTIDDRHVDLVLGMVLTIASVVCSRLVPKTLGGGASLWKAEWLALPLALFAAYVLLWGVRFAWDLRNSLLIAFGASPLAFIPFLGRGWSPLSGQINPLADDIARFVTPVERLQFGRYKLGTDNHRLADLRGLIDGRILSVVLLTCIISLLFVSRVDQRSLNRGGTGQASSLSRRTRKFSVFFASILTYWLVDIAISSLVLVAAAFLPSMVTTILTSPATGVIPTVVTGWMFTKWAAVAGLYLPSKLGILQSATHLPGHGPKSRSDHAITIGSLVLLSVTAILAVVRPANTAAGRIEIPGSSKEVVIGAENWSVLRTQSIDSFHGYFGSRSTWTRTLLSPAGQASSELSVDEVAIDRVKASPDLLTIFGVPATFKLGNFIPVIRKNLVLPSGQSAIQETYYDGTTASAWSIVTILLETPSGTERVSVSGRGFRDRSDVPVPVPSAVSNIMLRSAKPAEGEGKELKEAKVERTTLAVAELFSSHIALLTNPTTATAAETELPLSPELTVEQDEFVESDAN